MDYRGKYQVCNVCPRSKDCDYCSGGYRNDLNRGSDSDIVDTVIGIGIGLAVGELLDDIFE
jgi:hypothetical protein